MSFEFHHSLGKYVSLQAVNIANKFLSAVVNFANHNIKIANKSSENVAYFKIFGSDSNKSKFDSGGN
jgi:hypothetical protein